VFSSVAQHRSRSASTRILVPDKFFATRNEVSQGTLQDAPGITKKRGKTEATASPEALTVAPGDLNFLSVFSEADHFSMQLVIVHYHLNRGGVSQVIINHLKSLAASKSGLVIDRVAILYGGRRAGWPDSIFDHPPPFELELIQVGDLEYDTVSETGSRDLTTSMRSSLIAHGFNHDNTILHIHNHALGKNSALPTTIAELATDGYRVLLQVHDFAEDFRPENFLHLAGVFNCHDNDGLSARLYPQSPGIHYAVLNGRDRDIFVRSGITSERLHLLPNPVASLTRLPDRQQARQAVGQKLEMSDRQMLVTYPVRGIRRKNLGEMLLLSALDPREAIYAVTLAPLNPLEAGSFSHWHRLAQDLRLPCRFDVGSEAGLDYSTILAATDCLVTTSVAEGFGMVFLEAWLSGCPLVGRNLPEITADFSAAGIELEMLYDQLRIPLSMVDRKTVCERLLNTYHAVSASYNQPLIEQATLQRQLDQLMDDGCVDFAFLDGPLQEDVIRAVAGSTRLIDIVLDANPKLNQTFRIDPDTTAEMIEKYADIVREKFSVQSAGRQLRQVYQRVGHSPGGGNVEPLPRGQAILNSFLNIRRLHPIRLETWPLRKSSAN
jgi:glycosyltransferase involved in cell wall biosynthesis